MKKLILVLLSIGSIVQAKITTLPAVSVPANVVGGTVLMIRPGQALSIIKSEQAILDKELGQSERDQLYMAMVMEKSVSEIKAKYHSAKRPVTAQVISRYETILSDAGKAKSRLGSL
jgi:Na+/glutamate symporter